VGSAISISGVQQSPAKPIESIVADDGTYRYKRKGRDEACCCSRDEPLGFPAMIRWLTLALLTTGLTASAQDMPLSQILIDGEGWQAVGEGFQFTEGPAVDRQGNVYFVDVPASKIYKLDLPSRKITLFAEETGRASGLMFGGDGRLYACQNGARAIVAYDAAGKPAKICEDIDVNDLVVTRDNHIYVTDPKNHRVWHVDPAGTKTIADEGIERPNGIALWPDQRTLVVADSAGDRLWTFRIAADRSLEFKQPYYTLQLATAAILAGKTASGADGLKADSAGRVYVTSQAGLQVMDTQGRLSGVIARPQEKALSNVVFAGDKLDTLFVTAADKVYIRRTKATGLPSHEP
jgi:sugar lactone lactonase YvrE